jgi:predicted Zn-dependent peptidase
MTFFVEKILKNNYLYKLENGLRVIFTKSHHTAIVHCGFLINAGSRDESSAINGMAHYIEHTAFKGTKSRNSYQILNRIETIGGELNAYTTREKTCFYASSLKKYFDRNIELLADILFFPTFPEKELEKEKSVIIEEIEMYEDNPEETIFDAFHSMVFPGHSLGFSILGRKESVSSLDRASVLKFREENYTSDKIILSIVGNLQADRVESVVSKYLSGIELEKGKRQRYSPAVAKPFYQVQNKDYQQVHCIVGNVAYSLLDDKKYPLALLNNVLGGDWMSSRLNLSIREKNAYAYSVSSGYNAYLDSGLFSVQLGTDEKYLDRCITLIHKEFKRLREQKLSTVQLNRAKRQILGQYAMYEDNNSAIMQIKARNILDFNKLVSREEYFRLIETITSSQVLEVANEVLNVNNLSTLIYQSK